MTEYDPVGLALLLHKLKNLDDQKPVRVHHPEGHLPARQRMHGGQPIRMADGKPLSRWLLEGRERDA